MRALIIGAGVAGTVAAMALRKAGAEAEIFEAYEQSAGLAQGVFLTVAVNGLDALRAVDAHHVVRAGFPSGRIRFSSGTGRPLGAIALGPELPDGTVTHTIRRADLYGGLYAEAVGRGVPIVHGKRLTHAEARTGGGVVAHFADGTTAEGDVLIGADGVRSVVRTLIDPQAPAPRYTGLGNVGGFARVPGVSAEPGDYGMIWGRECFFGYTVAPDGEIWWFANPPRRTEPSPADLRALAGEPTRRRLIELLEVDRSPAAEIVRSTEDELRIFNQYDLPTVPRWHNASMVVLGDAAHAVSPASGQGASLAAEDAVTLGLCLRDARDVEAGLAEYERRRRDRVQRIVAWGSSMNNTKKQGLVGRALRDLALPLIMKRNARPEAMTKMNWMFGHHIDWPERRIPA